MISHISNTYFWVKNSAGIDKMWVYGINFNIRSWVQILDQVIIFLLLVCLLIICNLCWNRCFSVTCCISIKPFTISNIVSLRRALANPDNNSHGTRCWYFLKTVKFYNYNLSQIFYYVDHMERKVPKYNNHK